MRPIRLILKAANPQARPVLLNEIADVLTQTTDAWTPTVLHSYIANNHVPQEWIERVCAMLDANPTMIRVEKPEFIAAVGMARPDLYSLLTSTAGDAWLERCFLELGRALFVTPFLRFISGG